MLAGILEDESLLFRKNADRATEKIGGKFTFCEKEMAKLLPKIVTKKDINTTRQELQLEKHLLS